MKTINFFKKRNSIYPLILMTLAFFLSSCTTNEFLYKDVSLSNYGLSEEDFSVLDNTKKIIESSAADITGSIEQLEFIEREMRLISNNGFTVRVENNYKDLAELLAKNIDVKFDILNGLLTVSDFEKSNLYKVHDIITRLAADFEKLNQINCPKGCQEEISKEIVDTFFSGGVYTVSLLTLILAILAFVSATWANFLKSQLHRDFDEKLDLDFNKIKQSTICSTYIGQVKILVADGLAHYNAFNNLDLSRQEIEKKFSADEQLSQPIRQIESLQIAFHLNAAIKATTLAMRCIKAVEDHKILEQSQGDIDDYIQLKGWAYSNQAYYYAEALRLNSGFYDVEHLPDRLKDKDNIRKTLEDILKDGKEAVLACREAKSDCWFEMNESIIFSEYFLNGEAPSESLKLKIQEQIKTLLKAEGLPIKWVENTANNWAKILHVGPERLL